MLLYTPPVLGRHRELLRQRWFASFRRGRVNENLESARRHRATPATLGLHRDAPIPRQAQDPYVTPDALAFTTGFTRRCVRACGGGRGSHRPAVAPYARLHTRHPPGWPPAL